MNGRARLAEELGEEIEWFRSSVGPTKRIAERLGITVAGIEKRDRARAGESVAA
jgi:hypothetical protein